ncbi:hypothetical protein V8C26DRAFT_409592 [Trichoderma gracile]
MAAAEEEENQHSETLLWAIHMCAPASTCPCECIIESNRIAGASTARSLLADDDELIKDIRVYQLADYFRVEGLRDYALHNFESKIKHLWVSEGFVDCIREVYGATDLGYEMRKAILQVVRLHLGELWEKKAFRLLVREGGDFPMEILGGFINK